LEISGHIISIIASIILYLIKQFQLTKELK
jgi:hypothetical protein